MSSRDTGNGYSTSSGLAGNSTRPPINFASLAASPRSSWRGESGATGSRSYYYGSPSHDVRSPHPLRYSRSPTPWGGSPSRLSQQREEEPSSAPNYSISTSSSSSYHSQYRARSPGPYYRTGGSSSGGDRSPRRHHHHLRRRFPSPSPFRLPSPERPILYGSARPSSRLQHQYEDSNTTTTSSTTTGTSTGTRSRASTWLSGGGGGGGGAAGGAADDYDYEYDEEPAPSVWSSSNYGSSDAGVGRNSDSGSWRTLSFHGGARSSPVPGRVGESRAWDRRERRFRENGSP
ncbi:uncharacterized protein B0T15DRAFT_497442 [Chaetomium strumarium]|uniref:Uncharacterized protein n=1 Tax=Chaetomium strumarium TaxID=1170767 RepID=A0AAJ0LXY8_9PEZI|nr:hypothetical protein B0T15DRAFT_497442 [Chaetomium strumarium]